MAKAARTRYILEWRNRSLTADATSIEEMADGLEAAAIRLREMAEAGVQLDEDSALTEDYALLVTYDEDIAQTFDFEEDESGGDMDDDDY